MRCKIVACAFFIVDMQSNMMGSGEKALAVSCAVSFVLELMKVSWYTGVQYIKERSQGWGLEMQNWTVQQKRSKEGSVG